MVGGIHPQTAVARRPAWWPSHTTLALCYHCSSRGHFLFYLTTKLAVDSKFSDGGHFSRNSLASEKSQPATFMPYTAALLSLLNTSGTYNSLLVFQTFSSFLFCLDLQWERHSGHFDWLACGSSPSGVASTTYHSSPFISGLVMRQRPGSVS